MPRAFLSLRSVRENRKVNSTVFEKKCFFTATINVAPFSAAQ
jgi:hypothetical protein